MWKLVKQIARVGQINEPVPAPADTLPAEAAHIQGEILAILGKALCIRAVDAGSCNACELELHALNNPYYNLEGLGIKFVASPRHADMLLVTGPLACNMATALQRTYDAMPEPKLVVAVGDCARNGGIFGTSYACLGGIGERLPVDRIVPGCPPEPIEILRAILAVLQSAPSEPGTGSAFY